jgi:putative resolvase
LVVSQVVSEVGSGMNGHRGKLSRIVSDPSATVIVVGHGDRLTWFGFGHLAASLAASGRRIVVLEEAETTDDLVHDVTEVLTSLCARRCGPRPASGRAAGAAAVAAGRAGDEKAGRAAG